MRRTLNIPDELDAVLQDIAKREYRDVTNQILYALDRFARARLKKHTSAYLSGYGFESAEHSQLPDTKAEGDAEGMVLSLGDTKAYPEGHTSESEKLKNDAEGESAFSIEHALACDSIENSDEKLKAQAQAVLEAWKTLFPTARKLAYTRAVSWIQQRWDSAAEVVEVFLSVKERVDAGRAQVMPAFDNYVAAAIPPKEPRKPRLTAQQVTNDAGWVMRPPTPEEEAEDARTQEIAIRNGWWSEKDLEGLVP